MPTKVVFLLLPKLHLLDLAGPAKVFSTANDLGHGYSLYYVGEVPELVTTQGVALKADLDWPDLARDDLGHFLDRGPDELRERGHRHCLPQPIARHDRNPAGEDHVHPGDGLSGLE